MEIYILKSEFLYFSQTYISENSVSSSQSWYSSSENRKMVLWYCYALFQIIKIKITVLSILTSVSLSKFPLSWLKLFKRETWKISKVILSIWCYIETQNCLMSSSTNNFLLSATSVLYKHGLLLYQAGFIWTPRYWDRHTPSLHLKLCPQLAFLKFSLNLLLPISCKILPALFFSL